MTRYSDNILSGFQAATSAASSQSAVALTRTHNFTAVGGISPITQTGTFPPNTQNLSGYLYIIANASATVSDKITVSAGGTNLFTVDQFGSASGQAGATTTSLVRFTYLSSACATVAAPATNTTNGGEIPYAVTFLPVSADKTGIYQLMLEFTRKDRTFD